MNWSSTILLGKPEPSVKPSSRISAMLLLSLVACDEPKVATSLDDAVAAERIGPLEANCAGVNFGDQCVTNLSIDEVIDFEAEDATLLDHGRCYDEAGDAIDDCLWILVDQGPDLETVQYWLVPETNGCFLPTTECFADYRSPMRAVHQIDYTLLSNGFYLGTKTRYELAQTKQVGQAMVSSWKRGNTIELTQSYEGWGEPSSTTCQGMRVKSADGQQIVQDALCVDAIASSGSVELSVEEACGLIQAQVDADTTAKKVWWTAVAEFFIPDTFETTTNLKFDRTVGIKGAADKIEGDAQVGDEFTHGIVVTNAQPEGFMQAALLAGDAAALGAYITCLNNPHKFFPNMFDPPDAANPQVTMPLETWVDPAAAENCDAVSFTQIQDVEYTKDGMHCGANAPVNYTCEEGLGGICDCTGTADLTRATDEVCTT